MKEKAIVVLFIIIAIFIVLTFITLVVVDEIQHKEDDPIFTIVVDSNSTMVIRNDTYEPKEHLEELCWVRALTKLAQIYEDPNIIDASMSAGWLEPSWGDRHGHAWIEYTIQDGNEIRTITYDPSLDVYLEPLPEDANLLIPVIPYEPKEALRIIGEMK